ncbi:MAG: hypothetical protein K8J08_07715, partial [Thermoanaerobaculia bacterium]|nr:hypothetical protein [Thermoanaerobaculia bacterium]
CTERSKIVSKRWLKVEGEYLKRHADSKTLQELAERFQTDTDSVEAQLRELRIGSKADKIRAESEVELIVVFEKGMQALYAENWKEAAEALTVVAEGTGPVEIIARARQYAKVASSRVAKDQPIDPYYDAVVLKNAGDFRGALVACKKAGKDEQGRFAYLAATVGSLQGDFAEAARQLEVAFQRDPRCKGQARHDPDLQALRDEESFQSLFSVES